MDLLSASGIESLISSYRLYENAKRVKPLETRKQKISDLSSAWGTLKTKLSSLKSILESLKSTDSDSIFNSKTADVSDSDYLTATATNNAIVGTYAIRINQLAQYDSVVSDTKTSDSASGVQAGTLSFRVQSGSFDSTIEITTTGSETYSELMTKISDAINEASDGSVTASVFSPTTGNTKLSITAGSSGKDNEITLTDVTGNALDSVGLNLSTRTLAGTDGSAGYIYAEDALNAKLNFNGIDVERSSNTINDLITGVTLILKKQLDTGVPTINVTIDFNLKNIQDKINEFIDKFNQAYKYIKDNYNSTKEKRGIFTGNNNASNLKQKLSSEVSTQVTGLTSGALSYLSEIGVKFDPESGLSLSDSSKLEDAIKSKPDEVKALFNSSDGIATRLFDTVDAYAKTSGVIDNIVESYDSTVSYLSDKITYSNERIDKGAEILRKKYEMLQSQLATLIASQNSLSQLSNGFF